MDLHAAGPRPAPRGTRCWTLHALEGAVDVEVTAADDDVLGGVRAGLAELLGGAAAELWAGSSPLPPDLPLSAPELRHGAVLGLGRPGPREAGGQRSGALELHVTGGPEAGRSLALESGRHVLGRGGTAEVRLEDPDISRRHAVVTVGAAGIAVADLGSTNGTRLGRETVGEQPRPWRVGEVVHLGSTSLRVTGPGAAPAAVGGSTAGRLLLHPAPRLPVAPPEVEVAFPQPPEPAQPRRLPWPAVALPAVAGGLAAVALHTPTFLLFALLGPLVAVGSWASDRWSARSARRNGAADHAVAVAAAQARLAAALENDRAAAERAAPDLAVLLTAARRRSSLLWSRRATDDDALTVRLGTGPAPSHVTRTRPDGTAERVVDDERPVVADLRATRGLGVVGPRPAALAVLRSLVAQVVALHPPGSAEILLVTDPARLGDWAWSRWLPHLPGGSVLCGPEAARPLAARLAAHRAADDGSWLVVVVDAPADPRLAALLTGPGTAGGGPRVAVLSPAPTAAELAVPPRALLGCAGEVGESAVLSVPGAGDGVPVRTDRLGAHLAERLARDLAGLTAGTTGTALPAEVRLTDLPVAGLRPGPDGVLGGSWSRRRDALVAVLGSAASGPVVVDLCRSGPHALVAGTTGAGKSELLQTLIAGLALHHPPDRCSFLLVDYKGGAAFAEAAALPHTVGVLTDLDGTTTARALRSLAAELTRREALLGRHGAADVRDLPDGVDLARLVIVVDEFATLAEELPAFVPGLVGIAQRGRSLGVHLVLATQRPAGVVSAEIRANCSLRICLRTTDEADSRDVLGSPEAALLPADRPGRAHLRSGTGASTCFQAARVACPPRDPDAAAAVRRWSWPAPVAAPVAGRAPGACTDLSVLVRALADRAEADGVPAPHRPWLPPLPDRLPALPAVPGGALRVPLGLVDHPEHHTRSPLELDLDEGGCWLAVGGPRSGRTTLLRAVLAGAVATAGPDLLHVHALDHGGGALAAEAARLAHAGTCVGDGDPLRTIRLVDRLAGEVAARRAAASGPPAPRLLLLVDGVEQLMALLDECDPSRGSAAFLRLARDGAAAGLTCVLTADRAVPGSRLAALAAQRLVLPLADAADYAVAGVRAADVPAHRPPGRALLGEGAVECQLALPTTRPPRPGGAGASSPPPLRVVELPGDPVVVDGGRSDLTGLPLALGPGGDEGRCLTVDLLRTGGLLVVGPPGSGRSTALAAFAGDLARRGVPVLRLGTGPGAGTGAAGPTWVRPADPGALADRLATLPAGVPAVVVADDVRSAAAWPVLVGPLLEDAERPVVVLAAGAAGDLVGHYQGPLAALRRGRTGLLLQPGPAEADVLGVRLPRTPVAPRPGSGWLVLGGVPTRVQVARHRGLAEPDGGPG